jgi:hypothetical protein
VGEADDDHHDVARASLEEVRCNPPAEHDLIPPRPVTRRFLGRHTIALGLPSSRQSSNICRQVCLKVAVEAICHLARDQGRWQPQKRWDVTCWDCRAGALQCM